MSAFISVQSSTDEGARNGAGTRSAGACRMSRSPVEKLLVYQKAVAAADAIVALTDRPAFENDPELRRQLRASSGRIQSHLQEGSGQGTDRHYAHYVSIARGSSKEVKGHLRRALGCRLITEEEYWLRWHRFDEIAAMPSGLKKFLDGQDGEGNAG
jgi:four helix bundle protein